MVGATGTSVGARAEMMRCARPMSWAVGSTWPSGGRRSTQAWPAGSWTREGRLGGPPAVGGNGGGGQHAAQRGPAEPPGVARGVVDPVGEVGAPARDEAERERRGHLWRVG